MIDAVREAVMLAAAAAQLHRVARDHIRVDTGTGRMGVSSSSRGVSTAFDGRCGLAHHEVVNRQIIQVLLGSTGHGALQKRDVGIR